MKNFFFFFAFIFLLTTGFAQNGSSDLLPESVGISSERLVRLNQQMHEFVDKHQLSAVQTAIIRKGKLVHFDSYGYADLESKKAIGDNNIWRIYSMTKPIVSVALMMLYEEGKFQLNDPLHKYIPEFKEMKVHKKGVESISAKNKIKIVDILRHTSGIGYGWGPGSYVDSLYRKMNRHAMPSTKDLSLALSKIPLYFEPGTGWRYGLSTDVCGHLVELLSGQALDEFLAQRIFQPLKMADTFFEIPASKKSRFVTHYTTGKDGKLKVIDHPSTSHYTKKVTQFSGGGGLTSTAKDYLRFCQMLLNGGELDGHRLLSPKTIELMTQDHTKGIPYAGGPVVYPARGTGFEV